MNLLELLSISEAFSGLDGATRERIAASLSLREFPAGGTLAAQGEPGDALFLIVSGSVAVEQSSPSGPATRLGIYGPGAVLGELGLVTGHPRAATLSACEATTAALFGEEAFNRLQAGFPEQMDPLVQWMTGRLHRIHAISAIEESLQFRKLTPATKEAFLGCHSWLEIQAGGTVFTEGESGDALYLVVSGRIRLTKAGAGGERTLAELGKGDLLGEMALLTQQPRSATARAARDSQLARLDRSAFQKLLESSPQEWLTLFSEGLARRLAVSNSPKGKDRRQIYPPASIAVLPLSPSAAGFGEQLASALSVFGPTLHLTRERVEGMSGHRASSIAAVESRLLAWLNEQETLHRHVVFETGPADAAEVWNARCIRQADLILVVAEASQSPEAVAEEIRRALGSSTGPAPSLVLLHERAGIHAQGTAAWRAATGAARHFHVRTGHSNDVARIARALNERSVGLVLGGGFALGLGHIGVVQALRELAIPIDYVGGTSMGSILAAACAAEFPRELMLEVMHSGCAEGIKGDYTLPLVSLLTGRKAAGELGHYLAGVDIEDFWLPFFCISASLVSAGMVVHERGDALRSVLASCRAPGLFPPLGWDGDVLVDGGLVNNVPNDVMRDRIGPGTLISIDVSPADDFAFPEEFGLELSGWQLARRWARPFHRRKIPTIVPILFRLIGLGGAAQKKRIRSYADVYLTPPNGGFGLLDFQHGEEMAQAAHPYARKVLEDWIARNGRPWLTAPPR